MLNKKLEEQKLKIEKEKNQIEKILKEIDKKIKDIKKTNKQKIDVEIKKSNYKFEKKKLNQLPKNKVAKFIRKNFSSEYKENQVKIKEIEEKIEKLTQEKKQLNEKSDKLQSEIEKIDIKKGKSKLKEINHEIEKIKNKNQAIETLILSNPEILKEKKIMLDLLDENTNYIKFDKTNDSEVYIKCLENILKNERIINEKDKRIIKECIKEIKNPKKAEPGKYKIPHKYLYEQIRMSFSLFEKEKIYNIFAYKNYLETDCKIDKKLGKQIEELYENKKNYLFIHSLDNIFIKMKEEECNKIKESIFKEGLKSSDSKPNTLKYVTIGNNQKKGHFLEFLRPGKKILISIPKEYIENEGPIWGYDENEIKEEGGYILPQYIIGYINNDHLELNKALQTEKKEYKYTFSDGNLKIKQNNCINKNKI